MISSYRALTKVPLFGQHFKNEPHSRQQAICSSRHNGNYGRKHDEDTVLHAKTTPLRLKIQMSHMSEFDYSNQPLYNCLLRRGKVICATTHTRRKMERHKINSNIYARPAYNAPEKSTPSESTIEDERKSAVWDRNMKYIGNKKMRKNYPHVSHSPDRSTGSYRCCTKVHLAPHFNVTWTIMAITKLCQKNSHTET